METTSILAANTTGCVSTESVTNRRWIGLSAMRRRGRREHAMRHHRVHRPGSVVPGFLRGVDERAAADGEVVDDQRRLPFTSPMISSRPRFRHGRCAACRRSRGVPSLLAYCGSLLAKPVSGETTTRSGSLRRDLPHIGIAYRSSTGMRKKPWICGACRSSVTTRSTPAASIASAQTRARIDTAARPSCPPWRS